MKSLLSATTFLLVLIIFACNKNDGEIVPGSSSTPIPSIQNQTVVNILVIDAKERAKKILEILHNRARPFEKILQDAHNAPRVFFGLNPNIKVHVTKDYDDFNPNNVPVDIVNQSFSVYHWNKAIEDFQQFSDTKKFATFPLVISSAGNGTNSCTQSAYNFAKANGGLSYYGNIEPFFDCKAETSDCPKDAIDLHNACDVGSAYVIQETDHKKDWIVVGAMFGFGQKPGPILKDRWISTYYSFNVFGEKNDGTSYSTSFVVKTAAEIKRRAPHYSNNQIAQLIFSTADDIGPSGVDEIYGNGRMNVKAIFDELSKRGF